MKWGQRCKKESKCSAGTRTPPLACFARGRDDDDEEVGVEEVAEDVEEDDHHDEYVDFNNNYDAGSRTHPHLCLALGEGKIMKIMMMHLPSRESLPTHPPLPSSSEVDNKK